MFDAVDDENGATWRRTAPYDAPVGCERCGAQQSTHAAGRRRAIKIERTGEARGAAYGSQEAAFAISPSTFSGATVAQMCGAGVAAALTSWPGAVGTGVAGWREPGRLAGGRATNRNNVKKSWFQPA